MEEHYTCLIFWFKAIFGEIEEYGWQEDENEQYPDIFFCVCLKWPRKDIFKNNEEKRGINEEPQQWNGEQYFKITHLRYDD